MATTKTFVSHLYCPKCGKKYSVDEVNHLCECGSPLLVAYDLEAARNEINRDTFKNRTASLWRYKELLPIKDDNNIVTLGEGLTPLLQLKKAGQKSDIKNLYIKDEGIIPTGTFKARGAAVGVSKAKELGIDTITMPTNGNAGAAWSIYGAKAGIKSVIVMPEDAPSITRNDWYDASTLKEPYRIEGKKTMGLEIAEQLDWNLPDVIFYPTGGGVGIIGIYKALSELKELGLVSGPLPRLVAVQAEGCAPIVKAYNEKRADSEFFTNSQTIAFGINVPKALGDFLVLDALYKTNGIAKAVSDKAILEALKELASLEGNFVCPEGAAIYAAAKQLRQEGWIKADDKVVLLNTGAGIKYPDTLQIEVPYLEKESVID